MAEGKRKMELSDSERQVLTDEVRAIFQSARVTSEVYQRQTALGSNTQSVSAVGVLKC